MAIKHSRGTKQRKLELKYAIGDAISAFREAHLSEPERIWLSRSAGLLLIEELVKSDNLYDVPAMVTPRLKGVAFAMIKSAERYRR